MGGMYRPPLIGDIPIPEPLSEASLRVQPAAPPPVQSERAIGHMGKVGSSAMIASKLLRGWMEGLRTAEVRKADAANREVAGAKDLYAMTRETFYKFASRSDVREASQKRDEWGQANTKFGGRGPNGEPIPMYIARGQEPPFTPGEKSLLAELDKRKAAVEKSRDVYADTLMKYVIPELDAGKGKGKEKGVRGIPILGNILQAIAPNVDPQIWPMAMVKLVAEEEINMPDPSTAEQLEQERLAAFRAGAPLRAKEREVLGAELETRVTKAKLEKSYHDALNAYTAMPEGPEKDNARKRLEEMEDAAARGEKPMTTAERTIQKAQLRPAQVYLSLTDKMQKGANPLRDPGQFTQVELDTYNRAVRFVPSTIEQNILFKVGTQMTDSRTGQQRLYTDKDALAEMLVYHRQVASIQRVGTQTAQDRLFGFALAARQSQAQNEKSQQQFGKPFSALTAQEKNAVTLTPEEQNTAALEALSSFGKLTPSERFAAKVSDPVEAAERASEALLALVNEDKKFSRFVKPGMSKPRTTASGKVIGGVRYMVNPTPEPTGSLWWEQGQVELDAERNEFLGRATQKMREYGLSDEQIAQFLRYGGQGAGEGADAETEYTVTDPSSGQSRKRKLTQKQVEAYRAEGLRVESILRPGGRK